MLPNTTGKPNTDDYNLGRGIVYAAELGTDDLPDDNGWRDLGNAPEFMISVDEETLEHLSSREGLKVVDKEVTISQRINLRLKLDELNAENVTMLFSGEKTTHTNVSVAGFSEYEMISAVELGRWYDIQNSSRARAYDIETANLTVEKQGAPDVLLVEGTDYELDLELGRIFFLSTAVNCADGDKIDVTLAADAGAKTVHEIRALKGTKKKVALKFVSENPADDDKKREFQFHQVTLKAEGDLSLIGESWTEMEFTGIAERNIAADANSPTLTIRTVNKT